MKSDMGKLILRLELGILLLFHGIHKILFGIDAIKGMATAHHLPVWIAYGVFIGEVIGPLMIIIGFYTRIGALLIFANMLFARNNFV